MSPDFARRIDYWLGIPLCFCVNLFYRMKMVFVRDKAVSSPRKIMFIELSEMGAAILGYSAIKKAKEAFPGAQVYFLIFKENAESVCILNIMPKQNILTIRSKSLLFLIYDTFKVLIKIIKEGIDVVIDMELFSRFTSLLSFFSAAKIRVGFFRFNLEGLYRADTYTHKVMYNPYTHISRNFLTLVESLTGNQESPLLKKPLARGDAVVPRIESSIDSKDKIWHKLEEINSGINRKNKIVIINLGLGELLPLRRWPIENYIELIHRLLKDEETFVVLAGVKPETGSFSKTQGVLDIERCINIIGQTTVKEVIDLCNVSHLLISHDSGIVNIASLTPINIIVLFGPETPLLYAPLNSNKAVCYKNFACSPCFSAYNHRLSVCSDNRCLKAISVAEVLLSARRYLCVDN